MPRTFFLVALCALLWNLQGAGAMTSEDSARLDAICQALMAMPQKSMKDLVDATKDPVFDAMRSAQTPEGLSATSADTLYQYGKFYLCIHAPTQAYVFLNTAAEKGDIRAMKAMMFPNSLLWLDKAAKTGDAEAEFKYATTLEQLSNGTLSLEDRYKDRIPNYYTATTPAQMLADSIRWYKAAAAQSSPYQAQARDALARIQNVEGKRLAAEQERRSAEQLAQAQRDRQEKEEQQEADAAQKLLNDSLTKRKDIGDYVCKPDGSGLGFVEIVHNDKIEIRIHHHEIGNFLTHEPDRDYDTMSWVNYNEVGLCKSPG